MAETAEAPTGLKFIKGDALDFAAEFAKGEKVFVFEFWATWCPPCRTSIPHLSELQKKYKDKGVVFIGITNEDESTAKNFVEKMGAKMDYTVVVDENRSANKQYMEKYGVRGIPHAFVIGKDGKISWHGHPMEENFEATLESASNA